MASFRVFTDKKVLTVDDNLYDVDLYRKGAELTKLQGYIRDEYVYVYYGKEKNFNPDKPTGLYKIPNTNELLFHQNPKDLEKYHIDNIIQLNINQIFEDVLKNGEEFIDPSEALAIDNNKHQFKPVITHDDDVWKYIIKRVILQKKINLKNYRHLFESPHELNNMRSALEGKTKMSVKYFQAWCEILGIDWELTVFDNGTDKIAPMDDAITVTSHDRW